jgi:chromosome segregation protein
VTAPPELARALAGCSPASSWSRGLAEARAAVEGDPALVAVTREGDVLGRLGRRGVGSASPPSLLEVQAAVDESRRGWTRRRARERLRFALNAAVAEQQQAGARVEAALARLHESDARMAAVAEQLGQLASAARSAGAEAERLARSVDAASRR